MTSHWNNSAKCVPNHLTVHRILPDKEWSGPKCQYLSLRNCNLDNFERHGKHSNLY